MLISDHHQHYTQLELTVIVPNILDNFPRNTTRIHLLDSLRSHGRTPHIALLIHNLLQRVVLPAENVVAVVTEASIVTERVDKRLTAVFGPQGWVVEWCSLVDDLVHELRHADRM